MVTSFILFILTSVTCAGAEPKTAVLASLPAIFEPNEGQAPAGVRYISRGAGQTLLLQDDAVIVSLPATREQVRIEPVGGLRHPRMHGLAPLGGTSNYLKGVRSEWVAGVPQFERVRYENLYPGIDAVFYGTQKQLEFDLLVLPQADARAVRFRVIGTRKLITDRGELVIRTPRGELRLGKPYAYQQSESGRQTVECRFAIESGNTFGFSVGSYDNTRPLVIDPSLISTYLGGRDTDIPAGITTDASGNIYITGYTASTNFPLSPVNYKGTLTAGDADAFVIKLDPTASSVIYATYLGGSLADYGKAIAVDSAGAAYITGATIGGFPTTVGAFSTTVVDAPAIFVAKLNPAGNGLAYSTYLRGAGSGQAIALDASGNAYVAGFTYTATFTTTAGAFQQTYGGSTDAFVAKLNATGSSQVYSTFLGGSSEDQAMGLKLDAGGAMYVTGFTNSSNFPTTTGAFRTTYSGSTDVFVTKLASTGSTLLYSTYIGGPNTDRAYAIDISAGGDAFVAGQTYSSSFPTTSGAFRTTHGGGSDAFVTKLNPSGSALTYSTFLGGNGSCTVSDFFRLYQCDAAYALTLDASGQAYVAGLAGIGFQLAGAPQSTPGGNGDAFLAQLNSSGSALVLSTYAGGIAGDVALGLANSSASGPVVAGFSNSADFPGTSGALQAAANGGIEGFATRLGTCPVTLGAASSFFPATAGSYALTLTTAANCGWQATSDVAWVTFSSGTGTGNGQIAYTVAANSGGLRVGHITVNGSIFTVQQVSGLCVTLSSGGSWFPENFGTYVLNVFATCSWSVSTNVSWVGVSGGTQTGNGFFFFAVQQNTSGAARFAEINVGGQIYSVSQVGGAGGISCFYNLSSNTASFSQAGGSSSILVSTSPGCEWITDNQISWVTVTSGFAGSGEGVVGISISPNTSGQPRSGLLRIVDQSFTVSQTSTN